MAQVTSTSKSELVSKSEMVNKSELVNNSESDKKTESSHNSKSDKLNAENSRREKSKSPTAAVGLGTQIRGSWLNKINQEKKSVFNW